MRKKEGKSSSSEGVVTICGYSMWLPAVVTVAEKCHLPSLNQEAEESWVELPACDYLSQILRDFWKVSSYLASLVGL